MSTRRFLWIFLLAMAVASVFLLYQLHEEQTMTADKLVAAHEVELAAERLRNAEAQMKEELETSPRTPNIELELPQRNGLMYPEMIDRNFEKIDAASGKLQDQSRRSVCKEVEAKK